MRKLQEGSTRSAWCYINSTKMPPRPSFRENREHSVNLKDWSGSRLESLRLQLQRLPVPRIRPKFLKTILTTTLHAHCY
jgi:hypothetical protein